MASTKDENKLRTYIELGFSTVGQNEEQHYGNCLFCGDEEHFFVSEVTGQFDCKKCGVSGNVLNFLTLYHEQCLAQTSDEDYEELSQLRGIPVAGLKKAKVARDGGDWLIPAYGMTGEYVNDLRRWNQRRGISATGGCKLQLWNGSVLAHADEVWICEGEWDGIVLDWLFAELGLAIRAVAVPGASIFKEPWKQLFVSKRVTYAYDYDEPGFSGTERAYMKLKSIVRSTKFIHWPAQCKNGYDVRDFITAKLTQGEKPQKIWSDLRLLVQTHPARHIEGFAEPGHKGTNGKVAVVASQSVPRTVPRTFDEVLKAFQRWVFMEPDMELALRIFIAVMLTEQLPDDPLWIYLVSPPGGGKTMLLSSAKDSPYVEFRSTVSPRGLVSGFQRDPDPSLLARVHKKILIFKDGTELFSMPPPIQDEVFSILRGAYDGSVEREYGNGVVRVYDPLHFTTIIGVTPVVDGSNRATMGERFLKFRLRYKDPTQAISAAIRNVAKSQQMQTEVCNVVTEFLEDHMKDVAPPLLPEPIEQRIVSLAQLVSMLRATVETDRYTKEIFYRPEIEIGTRLAKQLTKLMMGLAIMEKRTQVIFDDYRIAHRVALDTAIGFHADIVRTLATSPTELTRTAISELTNIPPTTMERNLEAMMALGVVQCRRPEPAITNKPGIRPYLYSVTAKVQDLWHKAESLLQEDEPDTVVVPVRKPLVIRRQTSA